MNQKSNTESNAKSKAPAKTNNRASCIFYKSFYEALKELPEDSQLKIYNAIFSLSFFNEEPTNLKGVEKTVFMLIKPQLEANIKKFENGCTGGRPPQNQTQPQNQAPQEPAYTDAFNKFWELYPEEKRGSKEKSFSLYNRAIKAKKTTEEKIIEAVKNYKKTETVKKGFISSCDSWLINERFNDKPTTKGDSYAVEW